MKQNLLILLSIFSLLFTACKKEDILAEETKDSKTTTSTTSETTTNTTGVETTTNTGEETTTNTGEETTTNTTGVETIIGHLNLEKDLLLANYDFKTDIDDLQCIAGVTTLLADPKLSKINFYAVAGTYGRQNGLYVPPNDLLNLAFGNKWSDAHKDFDKAVSEVLLLAKPILENGGDLWIAEGGQSNFSAKLIKIIKTDLPNIDLSKRIHIIQHSNWNEKKTKRQDLSYVKNTIDYQKIADGNKVGNGTPGFNSHNDSSWRDKIKNPKLVRVWELAIELSNKYNGKDGRYDNEAVSDGGLDFSDTSEICWILGLENIKDSEEFFNKFSN